MPPVPADGVGLCEDLDIIYRGLDDNNEYKKMIDVMTDNLLVNCRAGNQIPRDRIPDYYINKYGVNNLYRYRFPGGFRGIYTILRPPDEINGWILDLLDHDEYDKRFGY